MRWSIIRLIWLRDLRDQLRDRRTLFMIVLLPLVLYPVLGVAVMQFAVGFVEQPSTIGVAGTPGEFPPRTPGDGSRVAGPAAAALLATPPGPLGLGVERLLGAALLQAGRRRLDYPPLVEGRHFSPLYFGDTAQGKSAGPDNRAALLKVVFLDGDDRAPLDNKEVDLILSASPNFWSGLDEDVPALRPRLRIQTRDNDDRSRQAASRLYLVLGRWKKHLKEVRLARRGLPAHYDDPVRVEDPERDKTSGARAAEGLFDLVVKVFPFVLVMWALAGALYPAVDLCAGEKERGTMETLLITPASREEIVLGKFLTIWVFSAGTSLMNLASMGATAWQFGSHLPGETLKPLGLVWCVALILPLSAFFSAISLAVGAYARSSKEGQYYLMPLFLVTMPLVFLTVAPGVELSPFYSLVPVTGVALLMQRLMGADAASPGTWLYFLPVLAPTALYSWLALRWAIEQFKREEVLFREAERLDLRLWLRRLFREKEAWPSAGQAVFCFAVIMGLRWLSLGVGGGLPPLVSAAVVLLAFVGTPAVLMALLLTTRPRQALALRPATLRQLLAAVLLASVVLLPLVQLTLYVISQFPGLKEMLDQQQKVEVFRQVSAGATGAGWAVLSIVVLPAVCEELAFRGFILTGLRRRFRPWTAILLSSFLFALYHLNVFQLLPTFLLGVVLGLLAVRSGSLWPPMLFHFLHNGLLVGITNLHGLDTWGIEIPPRALLFFRVSVTGLCTLLAVLILWRMSALGPGRPVLDRKEEGIPS
jgi:sodium transport system permease protein